MARGGLNHAGVWPGTVLAAIDWPQPWFAPWCAWGEPMAQEAWLLQNVAAALNAHGHAAKDASPSCASRVEAGHGPSSPSASASEHPAQRDPIRFVPQADLPAGEAYEAFIARTRQVPTRDGLHDFFNGLCWHRFPRTKRRLNALQSEAMARDGIGATRGPLRDALTLFDENAVLLQAPDVLWQALQARDWHRVFVALRPVWRDVTVVVFGHALLEKLVTPYKSITGHVYRLDDAAPCGDAALDDWLAHDLDAARLACKPFAPLPVLGIPGWWPANADAAFYDDAAVFRPRRALATS